MRYFKVLIGVTMAAAVTVALAGCGSESTPATPDARPSGGFMQPAGTVAVSFTVDDTANKVYGPGDLQWKGSMIYDPATRKITKDPSWGGPWATLYDDGPWNQGTPAGHEPIGAVANDHKWGITVFATPPATGTDAYEYGLNDNLYQTNFGNGWVWLGSNGTFNVAAGATAAINATGQTFPKFGTTDLQLKIDTNALGPGTWDTSKVGVKGSGWAWGVVDLTASLSGGVATFTQSAVIGAGKPFSHTGLFNSQDKPEFIFVFGTGTGKEYKDASGNALATGITAGAKASGASTFTTIAVTVYTKPAGNGNTYVTIP